MLLANFKLKRTAAASRGFLATARLSCLYIGHISWNKTTDWLIDRLTQDRMGFLMLNTRLKNRPRVTAIHDVFFSWTTRTRNLNKKVANTFAGIFFRKFAKITSYSDRYFGWIWLRRNLASLAQRPINHVGDRVRHSSVSGQNGLMMHGRAGSVQYSILLNAP